MRLECEERRERAVLAERECKSLGAAVADGVVRQLERREHLVGAAEAPGQLLGHERPEGIAEARELEGEQRAAQRHQIGHVEKHLAAERRVRPRLSWKRQGGSDLLYTLAHRPRPTRRLADSDLTLTSHQPQQLLAHIWRPCLAINTSLSTGSLASQTTTPLRPWGRESIATVVDGPDTSPPSSSCTSGGEKRLRIHSGTIGCRSRRSLGTVGADAHA